MSKKQKQDSPQADGIGLRVKARRTSLGMTQRECSNMAGVDIQLLRRVESGQADMRSDNLLKLAKALGVSTDYLLCGRMNDLDLCYLSQRISGLNERQQRCLWEIIERYCESHQPPNDMKSEGMTSVTEE